jgi:hypothetical protein
MTDEPGWSLTFAFPDQSPSFAYGFSCGRVWEQMKSPGASVIGGTFPVETRDTIEGMAMALGWIETIEDMGEGWINVTLVRPDGPDHNDAVPIVPQLTPGA